MEILIQNQQKKIPLSPPKITRIVKKILRREGIRKGFLSFAFVTDHKIKSLNKKFLHRDHPTDVLAFDLRNSSSKKKYFSKGKKNDIVEGEVIISTATAVRQAKLYQTPVKQEVILYVIHGILHLLGWDDDCERNRVQMRKKEQQLLKLVKPLV